MHYTPVDSLSANDAAREYSRGVIIIVKSAVCIHSKSFAMRRGKKTIRGSQVFLYFFQTNNCDICFLFSAMPIALRSVLISDAVDDACVALLTSHGVPVTKKYKMSKDELLQEIKVYLANMQPFLIRRL